MAEKILAMRDISKSFVNIEVLHKVDFSLVKGEVHALVGQNGAGKSTMMKILNGVYTKDSGTITIEGQETEYNTTIGARQYGISMVFQEFSLVPSLPVYQNVFLGKERRDKKIFLDDKKFIQTTEEILRTLDRNVTIDPKENVENLSIGQQQFVEIAKSLTHNPRILILDEPTASLTHAEIESLFNVIKEIKKRGISIIYISHYLRDIFKICDRVTVLRDGRKVFTKALKDTDIEDVIKGMLGKQFNSHAVTKFKAIDRTGVPLLEVRNLTAAKVEKVSFQLWPGEILGIAGLLGSGRTEIFHSFTGISIKNNGDIRVNGETVKIGSTKDSIELGISLIPEDRRTQGLITNFPISENILLPILRKLKRLFFVNDREGQRIATDFMKRFNIKAKDARQEARFLSGGNQQKVVVAKGMVSRSKVLLLDDPTFGIDVQSKREIMDIVRDFVTQGNGAIFISSELEEIAEICDRILILKKGAVTQEIDNSKAGGVTEEDLLRMIQ